MTAPLSTAPHPPQPGPLRTLHLAPPLALVCVLFIPWLVNPSWGPSPVILQTALAAAAAIVWFVLPPASRGPAARLIALAWLAGAAVNAAIALGQYFNVVTTSSWWISAASPGEAYGNLRQRNQLASLLSLGLASAFFLAAGARGSARAALAAVVVLLSAACALTASRTGLLQWLALSGLVLLFPLRGGAKAWWGWGILALASYALALAAGPALYTVITGQDPTTLIDRLGTNLGCVSRKVLWANALYLASLRPWTGWGLGNFDYAHQVTLYPGERFCLIVDNAHNLFLHVAAEGGFVLAGLLLVGLTWAVLRARPWRERDPARLLAWGALGVLMLHSQVEYPLWYGPFQLAALLALSLLLAPRTVPRADAHAARPPAAAGVGGAGRLVLAALATAALGYVLWDYHRVSQLFLPESARSAAYRTQTLPQVSGTVLFKSQVAFAQFTTTELTPSNAALMAELGEFVLHYSPEPQVVEKLIDAWRLAGRAERADWHELRFRVAFPQEHAEWQKTRAEAKPVPAPGGATPAAAP
jgi:O-antigen ligase